MSWQSYVDQQLVGSGNFEKAALLGHDGSSWAASPGFTISEAAAIAALAKDPKKVLQNGVTVAGVKYLGIKGDERSAYGKKGSAGVCIVKTNQVIIIGVYKEGQQPGNAATTIEKLADYLIEQGY
jgi:profilin